MFGGTAEGPRVIYKATSSSITSNHPFLHGSKRGGKKHQQQTLRISSPKTAATQTGMFSTPEKKRGLTAAPITPAGCSSKHFNSRTHTKHTQTHLIHKPIKKKFTMKSALYTAHLQCIQIIIIQHVRGLGAACGVGWGSRLKMQG
jgi:hypothetical protein